MKQRTPLGNVDLNVLIQSCKKSCFRVEAMDSYKMSNEDIALARYSNGEQLFLPPEPAFSKWWAFMEECNARGVPHIRIRPVPRKIPPYVRMEIDWGYNHSTRHGEDIRVLIKEDNPDIKDAWDEEYYLFDDKRLLYIVYDSEGGFVRFDEEHDPAEIQKRLQQKDQLLKSAVPYQKFVALLRSSAVTVEISKINALSLNVV